MAERYCGPLEILEKMALVAYMLEKISLVAYMLENIALLAYMFQFYNFTVSAYFIYSIEDIVHYICVVLHISVFIVFSFLIRS